MVRRSRRQQLARGREQRRQCGSVNRNGMAVRPAPQALEESAVATNTLVCPSTVSVSFLAALSPKPKIRFKIVSDLRKNAQHLQTLYDGTVLGSSLVCLGEQIGALDGVLEKINKQADDHSRFLLSRIYFAEKLEPEDHNRRDEVEDERSTALALWNLSVRG